ncbi:hypothetical protein CYLTODRAFT_55993 [Cylindrobasidium torrendii FP15055 ss-10]|uniref:Fungal STAND N-terminal Goodbye domain-containing protein n=1 Tax=Cylindrobasidium torrendii FP15055 ss-10 TaxID=1314674 RepID=A0A0D7BP18_9AGAR|nr:hypothetical protein CYLTODRAFT_55993 [Cylindrobasidium torrendii FP15055 ss-10]
MQATDYVNFSPLRSTSTNFNKGRIGIDLCDDHEDSARFLRCTTTTDVLQEFEKSMEALAEFREEKSLKVWARIKRKLNVFVDILLLFNDALAEMASALSAPGGKTLFVAFHILLKATKANDERLEEVAALLSKLEFFLKRLRMYLRIHHWDEYLRETFVKMLVLSFESLAIATKEMKRGRKENPAYYGCQSIALPFRLIDVPHASAANPAV